MQIFQWLSKKSTHEPAIVANPSPVNKKRVDKDPRVKSNHIIAFNDCGVRRRRLKGVEETKLSCENLNLFYFIRRKDVSRACFYHTLNLKRPRNSHIKQQNSVHSMKMTKEDIARGLGISQKSDSTHVGNKVLPITDSAQTSSAKNNDENCPSSDKKEKTKGDNKMRTISRMKELLKWAAAAKAHERGGKYIGRKMLQFRNRGTLKAITDDDQLSNDSPKISFRWEVESCSTTTSSVYSAISKLHGQIPNADSVKSTPSHGGEYHSGGRSGSWITTDSEFVVLELEL